MIKRALFLFVVIAFFGCIAHAQELKAGAIRAGVYAGIGCVNAHLKKKGWKGCWKQSLDFGVDAVTEQVSIELLARGHFWPGKLMQSLAASRMENKLDGMTGLRTFCRYRTDYLVGSFGYDFCKNDFQPRFRVAQTAAAVGIAILPRTRFDVKKSLKFGVPVFISDSSFMFGKNGLSLYGTVAFKGETYNSENDLHRAFYRSYLERHEMIHAVIQLRRQYLCSYVIDRSLFGGNYHKFPWAIGQEICVTPFALGGEKSVWEREARAFENVIVRDIAKDLVKKIRRGELEFSASGGATMQNFSVFAPISATRGGAARSGQPDYRPIFVDMDFLRYQKPAAAW